MEQHTEDQYEDNGRRRLSEEETQLIIKRVLDQVYSDVGKGVLKRLGWLLVAGFTTLAGWLAANHISLK